MYEKLPLRSDHLNFKSQRTGLRTNCDIEASIGQNLNNRFGERTQRPGPKPSLKRRAWGEIDCNAAAMFAWL